MIDWHTVRTAMVHAWTYLLCGTGAIKDAYGSLKQLDVHRLAEIQQCTGHLRHSVLPVFSSVDVQQSNLLLHHREAFLVVPSTALCN